jgi:hypothetical protein
MKPVNAVAVLVPTLAVEGAPLSGDRFLNVDAMRAPQDI